MMAEAEQGNQEKNTPASEEEKGAAAPVKKQGEGKANPRKHKRAGKRGPWVLILVVIVAIAGAWFFAPATIRQDISSLFTPSESQPEKVASKVPEPVAPPQSRIARPIPPHPQSAVSSEEVAALRNSVEALQRNLGELREESIALRQTLSERQLPDIKARLNWIANPASTLDQIYFAWSDISVAAGIDDEQRAEADRMRDLAARHWKNKREWAAALEAVFDSLTREDGEDAEGADEATLQASFMNWLKENFYLKRSDAGARMAAAELAKQLSQSIKSIEGEQWPESESWQKILVSIRESGEQISGFPGDFDGIGGDIDAMRTTARTWLERL